MAMNRQTVIIWVIVALSVVLVLMLAVPASTTENPFLSTLPFDVLSGYRDSWIAHLAVNLLGYATILVPGYILKCYVQRSKYLDVVGKSCTRRLALLCFRGNDDVKLGGDADGPSSSPSSGSASSPERATSNRALLAMFCLFGLLGSYLTWGLLQEKVMTREYSDGDGIREKFTDSQFLVFVNRILAFALSGVYVAVIRQPPHRAPLYKYCFCSFSNVMSSWCQYEALKYVSFPTQVLAKASKIIPVMLMGKLVSRKKYDFHEYVTAVAISMGMTLFLLGSDDRHRGDGGGGGGGGPMTTVSGVVILASYMAFDSFTSSWQGQLFHQHRMTSMQMMCGVNLFSCLFTAVSLVQQGGFVASTAFALRHPSFLMDISLLSVTSATGQLFIFYTIAQFGPVAFVIMMTIRQGLAILLSCLVYGHSIEAYGVVGIALVFLAIFVRIYVGQRKKQLMKKHYQKLAMVAVEKI